jgi:hypothetical protein
VHIVPKNPYRRPGAGGIRGLQRVWLRNRPNRLPTTYQRQKKKENTKKSVPFHDIIAEQMLADSDSMRYFFLPQSVTDKNRKTNTLSNFLRGLYRPHNRFAMPGFLSEFLKVGN